MTFANGVPVLFLVAIFGDVQSEDVLDNAKFRVNYYSELTSYGYLRIFYSSQWMPILINGFDMHEANLVCRELGYGFASRYATAKSLGYQTNFDQAMTNYSVVYNVECPMTATSFSSCSYSSTIAHSDIEDVGIVCTNFKSTLRLVSSSGNIGNSSGRLQIFINSTWGTVCDDDFGSVEARIACRQLGFYHYSDYSSAGDLQLYSSNISGPIWLDNLKYCTNDSTDLRNCTRAVGVHHCTHSEDVVLSCYSVTPPPSTTSTSTTLLSPGAVAGLVIGLVILMMAVFIGVILCVVAIVVYRKKRSSQVRTAKSAQNTRMSDITEQDNTAVSEPAPGNAPDREYNEDSDEKKLVN